MQVIWTFWKVVSNMKPLLCMMDLIASLANRAFAGAARQSGVSGQLIDRHLT